MLDDLTKPARSTPREPYGPTLAALVMALLMPTAALAQSRTFYGADGRAAARSTTDSSGSTTIYGADGRVTGRTSTSSNGTTTIYGSDGRRVGTVTKSPAGR